MYVASSSAAYYVLCTYLGILYPVHKYRTEYLRTHSTTLLCEVHICTIYGVLVLVLCTFKPRSFLDRLVLVCLSLHRRAAVAAQSSSSGAFFFFSLAQCSCPPPPLRIISLLLTPLPPLSSLPVFLRAVHPIYLVVRGYCLLGLTFDLHHDLIVWGRPMSAFGFLLSPSPDP